MATDSVKPGFTSSSPNPPLNLLHPAVIIELPFLSIWGDKEEEKREGRKQKGRENLPLPLVLNM
jgi:hypothetical protein